MLLPLSELAVTTAVPRLFTLAAALGSERTALSTLGVLHEFFEDLIGVQLHHAVHVLFGLLGIRTEEALHLVLSDLLPIAAVHDFGAELGKDFHDERT